MKLVIAVAGKLRAGPESELIERYMKRLPWKVTITEIMAKSKTPEAAKHEEGELLSAAVKSCRALIAMDEHGKALSSREFAESLSRFAEQGRDPIGLVIGGADGLAPELLKKADLTFAFGRATWPHMLARVMLAEQLYRASTLLAGHPYHRD